MSRQLQTLGISYDRSRIQATCDPAYYRWTQWLFLKLNDLGLVTRKSADLAYCPSCQTVLSHLQVVEGGCWRCGTKVETRRFPQWFLDISRYAVSLLAGLDRLEGWSATVRNLVRGLLHSQEGRVSMEKDWLISRQRSWGTPIPVIFCEGCGTVPVPTEELPVRLPDDLDWSLGPRALSSHPSFVKTVCPRCHRTARRETDTLDCFFDDIWCFLACLVDLDGPPSFRGRRVQAWMPVDRFHSGFDTIAYLHLHRFFAAALHEHDELDVAEPIQGHLGHEMVLSQGRKMSKHLGNAVSPSSLMRLHGADALRVTMLWAAAPHTAIEWRPEQVERASSLLQSVHRLYAPAAAAGMNQIASGPSSPENPSRAMLNLQRKARRSFENIGRFVEEYRPNAAVEELAVLFRQTETFTLPRLRSARLSPADGRILHEILRAESIVLSLFAPHLAEEVWHLMGNESYVVQQSWPHLPDEGPAA
jgi:leucyl-tRNA synthetase